MRGDWLAAAASLALALLAVGAVVLAGQQGPRAAVQGGLEALVSYRAAPDVAERMRERLASYPEEAAGSADAREAVRLLDEGWIVLEVNLTIVNKSPEAYAIQAGGPCSTLPGAPRARVPLDEDYNSLWPRLTVLEGDYYKPRSMFCGAALFRTTLPPGGSATYTFYYLVSPDFKGIVEAEAVACKANTPGDPFDDAQPGSCTRLTARAEVDAAQAVEASASR